MQRVRTNNMVSSFDEIKIRIFSLNKDEIALDFSDINPEADIHKQVAIDSLQFTELYAAIVEEFNIQIRQNLIVNTRALIKDGHFTKYSINCALLPFCHLFGLQTGVLLPLMIHGSLLIVEINNFQRLSTIANEIEQFKVSNIYSLPLVYYLLSIAPDIITHLNHVRSYVSGGDKLPLFAITYCFYFC